MGCKGKVSVSIIHPGTINHIVWSLHGQLSSLWMQKTTKSLYNIALMNRGEAFKDPHPHPLGPAEYLFVQINLWILTGRKCARHTSAHYGHISRPLPRLYWGTGGGGFFCGQQWEAMEGNWLLLTRGCQNGDGAAVHFQFQPTDWNPPLGSPVSQAPFSEPMVWKTWFNSCSMLFIRFSISPNRLCVASYWRSNCASLRMVDRNILW